jgi:hypothetical protein
MVTFAEYVTEQVQVLTADAGESGISQADLVGAVSSSLLDAIASGGVEAPDYAFAVKSQLVKNLGNARSSKIDVKFFEGAVGYKDGSFNKWDKLVEWGNTPMSMGSDRYGMVCLVKHMNKVVVSNKIDDHWKNAEEAHASAEEYNAAGSAFTEALTASNKLSGATLIPGL